MSLFWQEMRKIWRPGILAALVLLGGLYYTLRLSFSAEQYGGGFTEARAEHQLRMELIERFGPALEFEDIPLLEDMLAEEAALFAQQVLAVPEAAEAGLTTYEAVYAIWNGTMEQVNALAAPGVVLEHDEAWDILNAVRLRTNYSRIYALDGLLTTAAYRADDAFDWTKGPRFQDSSPRQQARLTELERQRRANINLISSQAWAETFEYLKFSAVWVVLSVILLLSPTLVRDRLHRMRPAQWASRRGRRVLQTQMAAGLASAAALTALDVAVLAVPLMRRGAGTFFACSLYNCSRSPFPWFDWTYGQYLLAMALVLLVLGVTAGALSLFLSQYSANYVSMLLKAAPLFVAVGVGFAYPLADQAFFFHRSNSRFINASPAFEVPVLCAALAVGLGVCVWSCVRLKRREL